MVGQRFGVGPSREHLAQVAERRAACRSPSGGRRGPPILGPAVLAVARVTKAGDDVRTSVDTRINCRGDHFCARATLPEDGQSFRGGNQANRRYPLRAPIDKPLTSLGDRAAGRDHRIQDNCVAAVDLAWKCFAVVIRKERHLVPSKTDHPNLGLREHRKRALEHPEAGTEDRDQQVRRRAEALKGGRNP